MQIFQETVTFHVNGEGFQFSLDCSWNFQAYPEDQFVIMFLLHSQTTSRLFIHTNQLFFYSKTVKQLQVFLFYKEFETRYSTKHIYMDSLIHHCNHSMRYMLCFHPILQIRQQDNQELNKLSPGHRTSKCTINNINSSLF